MYNNNRATGGQGEPRGSSWWGSLLWQARSVAEGGEGEGRPVSTFCFIWFLTTRTMEKAGGTHFMQMAVRGRGSGRLISGIVEIINKGEGRVKKGETGERREGAESVTSGCRVWHTYFTKVPNRKHRRRHFVKFIAKWPPCECQLPTLPPPPFPSLGHSQRLLARQFVQCFFCTSPLTCWQSAVGLSALWNADPSFDLELH